MIEYQIFELENLKCQTLQTVKHRFQTVNKWIRTVTIKT